MRINNYFLTALFCLTVRIDNILVVFIKQPVLRGVWSCVSTTIPTYVGIEQPTGDEEVMLQSRKWLIFSKALLINFNYVICKRVRASLI